ncbi:glycosyltransferase [Methylocystis sp. B8]|uniref:glycosyltransferase n=1 Tax=Methylocystis sp. B8 TaxID=544938 RepID=UPI0010FE1415|nr:glycosyltransferase [Methylocystis sp. B8]TLG71127.1 glycosyltransferase [Methylocystis sp. B8]
MNQSRQKRAFFVINSLEGGGAERVFTTLIERLSDRLSADIELVLLDRLPEIYKIPVEIRRHQLDCRQGYLASVTQLVALVRRERPDLLFSFLTRSNCAAVVAGSLTGAPVTLSERVHTSSHLGQGAAINKLIVRLLYPLAKHIVATSHGVAQDLRENYGVSATRISVMYNPVQRDYIMTRALEPAPIALPPTTWLAIGRLTANKNFAMLIDAFAQADVPGDLVILGEGPERQALLRLAAVRGIGDRVHLPGFVDNPYACLRRAYAYLSASNAEGFPNSLVEALVVGVPVAVTDCDSGPSEVLGGALASKVKRATEAEHGILVPMRDSAAMAEAMRKLAASAPRAHYAERALRRSEDFDFARTLDEYATLLNAVISGETSRR